MIRRISPVVAAFAVAAAACSTVPQGQGPGSPSPAPVATPSMAATADTTPAPIPTLDLLPSSFMPEATATADAIDVQLGTCCAFLFQPYELTAKEGRIELFLTNPQFEEFPFDHDMQIGLEMLKPLVASPVLGVGESGLWVIDDLPAAEYAFWCSVDRHHAFGMTGTLTVTP